jgi:uncharacterized protein with von Willebrand factor type A (vWA) domain
MEYNEIISQICRRVTRNVKEANKFDWRHARERTDSVISAEGLAGPLTEVRT